MKRIFALLLLFALPLFALFADEITYGILMPDPPGPAIIHGLPPGFKYGTNQEERVMVIVREDEDYYTAAVRWKIQAFADRKGNSAAEQLALHTDQCKAEPDACRIVETKPCKIKRAEKHVSDCRLIAQVFKDEEASYYVQRIFIDYQGPVGPPVSFQSTIMARDADLFKSHRALHLQMTEDTFEPRYVMRIKESNNTIEDEQQDSKPAQ